MNIKIFLTLLIAVFLSACGGPKAPQESPEARRQQERAAEEKRCYTEFRYGEPEFEQCMDQARAIEYPPETQPACGVYVGYGECVTLEEYRNGERFQDR